MLTKSVKPLPNTIAVLTNFNYFGICSITD